MTNDKTITIRISKETYSKLKTVPNYSQFIRTIIEEKFNKGDYTVGDFTYITRQEVKELIIQELNEFGIKNNRGATPQFDI